MDFWSRLIGGTYPKKPTPKQTANDPQARLARFRRVFNTIVELCNRPRNPGREGPLLADLHACLQRLVALIREETRAPIPHTVLQFASAKQIYIAIARAAAVSQHEAIIQSAIAVFAALIDSEEEDFLSSGPFAKSLMRLITRVVDSGNVLIGIDTETSILELLFTISAKIRLQPEILSVWFQSATNKNKPHAEHVFVKKSFVGITQKDDFPLCYLLIDRVHHEGRIGDFARTGLLYIFEATGRSLDLEAWVVSSDLPTLMASGLGALYSQLSRELSILHPDATLPAVLAMSDYSTTHPRAMAESAFSEKHASHMATFLSYLAFWQDVLDHCRSADVKQTLLDHFQILFLQQLLYPSLLQSSDTDGGSSVAVLTYMTAMLDALEYPDLVHMILAYLLAISDDTPASPSVPTTPVKPSKRPPSPSAVRRRQSLMLLNAHENPDDAVEPALFNLTDLVLNSVASRNSQTVFAALKLTSTIIVRQRKYALGTLLKVQCTSSRAVTRTSGALELEVDKYAELSAVLHGHYGVDEAYAGLCDDVRHIVEGQVPFKQTAAHEDPFQRDDTAVNLHDLPIDDPLLRALRDLLRTFFTNSVDVNLALTQAIISIASCTEIKLDAWLALDAAIYSFGEGSGGRRAWQSQLDEDERDSWSALQQASRRPDWPDDDHKAPLLYHTLKNLALELETVRTTVPNIDQLLSGRKSMLQAASIDMPPSEPPSQVNSPTHASFVDIPPQTSRGHSRNISLSESSRGRSKATSPKSHIAFPPGPGSLAASISPNRFRSGDQSSSASPAARSIFQPPPPETPSTTDVLMQTIRFSRSGTESRNDHMTDASGIKIEGERSSSLNHVLSNVVVLQEFILELVAVLQVRAAVLGESEVRLV